MPKTANPHPRHPTTGVFYQVFTAMPLEVTNDPALQAYRQVMKNLMQTVCFASLNFRSACQVTRIGLLDCLVGEAIADALLHLICEASYSEPSPGNYVDAVGRQYVELALLGVAGADLLRAEGKSVDADAVAAYRIMPSSL